MTFGFLSELIKGDYSSDFSTQDLWAGWYFSFYSLDLDLDIQWAINTAI